MNKYELVLPQDREYGHPVIKLKSGQTGVAQSLLIHPDGDRIFCKDDEDSGYLVDVAEQFHPYIRVRELRLDKPVTLGGIRIGLPLATGIPLEELTEIAMLQRSHETNISAALNARRQASDFLP